MEDNDKRQLLRAHEVLKNGIDRRRRRTRKEWIVHDITTGDQTRYTFPEHYPKKTEPETDWAKLWTKDKVAKAKIMWE